MTEQERLSKIVDAQGKEIKRLRQLLQKARVASSDMWVEDGHFKVIVTAVGVEEYDFTQQCRAELTKLAEALIGQSGSVTDTGVTTDSITGEEHDTAQVQI